MDIQLKKIRVVEMLLRVKSEALINQMEKLLEKELVVAYTTDGKPLTQRAYNKRQERAEKELLAGKTINQEDLEREVSKW